MKGATETDAGHQPQESGRAGRPRSPSGSRVRYHFLDGRLGASSLGLQGPSVHNQFKDDARPLQSGDGLRRRRRASRSRASHGDSGRGRARAHPVLRDFGGSLGPAPQGDVETPRPTRRPNTTGIASLTCLFTSENPHGPKEEGGDRDIHRWPSIGTGRAGSFRSPLAQGPASTYLFDLRREASRSGCVPPRFSQTTSRMLTNAGFTPRPGSETKKEFISSALKPDSEREQTNMLQAFPAKRGQGGGKPGGLQKRVFVFHDRPVGHSGRC